MRYEIRVIKSSYRDGAGQLVQPLGRVIVSTDDALEAEQLADASASAYEYGVAILDTVDRLVYWGDGVTDRQSLDHGRVEVEAQ